MPSLQACILPKCLRAAHSHTPGCSAFARCRRVPGPINRYPRCLTAGVLPLAA